jgi:hypothetical protein
MKRKKSKMSDIFFSCLFFSFHLYQVHDDGNGGFVTDFVLGRKNKVYNLRDICHI